MSAELQMRTTNAAAGYHNTFKIGAALTAVICLVSPGAHASTPDYEQLFKGRNGCFRLHDLTSGKDIAVYNPTRCRERISPCSTFKVPLALMAFDKGVLKDANSGFPWD